MNALTAVQNNAVDSARTIADSLSSRRRNPRVCWNYLHRTDDQSVPRTGCRVAREALEYKSFLRFRVGKILDDLVRISCNRCC